MATRDSGEPPASERPAPEVRTGGDDLLPGAHAEPCCSRSATCSPRTRPGARAEPARRLDLEVQTNEAGARLDRFLADRLGDCTRSQIQRLIREGRVQLDRTAARPGIAVRAGDMVRVEIPAPVPATPRPEALPLDVVYDDADLLVVDKPAGMVVHPAAGHAEGTLVNALLHHVRDLSGIGGELRPGIVHRLDRGTSGLLVVAKHDRAHAELARQFADREVEKEYAALVWGLVRQGRRIDLPIGRDPVDRKRISIRSRRAREAVTRVVTAEALDGVTLVRVAIATGRTHQIRVHLSAVGHPVVGDADYGGRRRRPPPHLRIVERLSRPFLHAARLAFTHPRDGRRLEVCCALPDDLADLAEELRTVTQRRAAGRRIRAAAGPPPEETCTNESTTASAHMRAQYGPDTAGPLIQRVRTPSKT